MTKPAKLDTFYPIETPEGINLLFRPASPLIRSIALLIDILVQIGIAALFIIAMLVIITKSGYSLSGYPIGFALILLFIIYWWYFVLLEVLNKGQSIGKRFCKIKVIHDDGTPIGWSSSLLRNLLRAVDVLPSFSYGIGLITGLSTKQFKRLGDIAAGTLVVYDEDATTYHKLPVATAINCPFQLSPEEQQIIISFAERSETLSAERRLELASLLSSHFELTAEQTEQRLYQIAHYLIGSDAPASGNNQ